MKSSAYKPNIRAWQLSVILIASRVAFLTVFLHVFENHTHPKDAWLSATLSSIIALFITVMIVFLSKRHPDLSFVEMCMELLGTWGGRLVSFIYLWFFLHIAYLSVRQFSEVIHMTMMPETPVSFLNIVMTIAIIFTVTRGLKAIAQTSSLTVPISIALILFTLILFIKDIRMEALLPVMEKGIKPVLFGSLVPAILYGESLLILVFFPYVKDKHNMLSLSIIASIFSSILFIFVTIIVISVFGANEAKKITFPLFSLTKIMSISNIRYEALMIYVWTVLLFVKATIYFYASVISIGQWLSLKSYKGLIIPVGVFILIFSFEAFESTRDIINFFSQKYYILLAYTIEILVPLLLIFISILRKRKT